MKAEHQLLLSVPLVNKTDEEQDNVKALLDERIDWCEA